MARTKRTNKELAIRVGQAIRAQRKIADMTQEALAEAIELQSETISRFENGQRTPSLEKLAEIADVLGVPIAVFFEDLDGSPALDADPYAQKLRAALDKLPDEGKNFVLVVAQDYARYHVPKPKKTRK
ncbi:helix-turn-helix domain-containing protein [Noviherbaspirillum sp. ST9]|uniref:helix-turn-helix domain-containing protein n=1 Tax=Noviherbaspirillum sp. ST9 TaxID=3401606 RepID=UPI003B586C56